MVAIRGSWTESGTGMKRLVDIAHLMDHPAQGNSPFGFAVFRFVDGFQVGKIGVYDVLVGGARFFDTHRFIAFVDEAIVDVMGPWAEIASEFRIRSSLVGKYRSVHEKAEAFVARVEPGVSPPGAFGRVFAKDLGELGFGGFIKLFERHPGDQPVASAIPGLGRIGKNHGRQEHNQG